MHLEITDLRTLTDEVPNIRELEFRNAQVTIGSHSSNLVQLPDIDIALYHATLQPAGEHWVYEPKTRDAQTSINGAKVGEKAELHDGDVIEITHFSLKITLDAEVEFELPDPAKAGELSKIRQYPLPPRSEVRKADADIGLTAERQKVLARFALKLRACGTIAQLLERTVEMLQPELTARVVWMGVRRGTDGPMDFVHGLNDGGQRVEEPPMFETFQYRCLTRHQFISIPRTGQEETQSVVAVPILAERGAIGLIYADTRRRTHVFDETDLDFVTVTAALVRPLLEDIFEERLESARGSGSAGFTMVHDLRAKLDPRNVPQWPTLQIAVFSSPGQEKAGDLHDVMKLPNGLAAILVGHVEADATLAAAAIAESRGTFRMAGLHADPPQVQLKALNWLLFNELDPCRLDVAVVVINPKTGAAEIGTAGAVGAVVVDKAGNPRKVNHPNSPAVGTVKNFEYVSGTLRLEEHETLALLTRGCTKVRNEAGHALGEAKLMATLCDGFGQPAGQAIADLVTDLAPYLKDGYAPDDITILLVHRPS